MIKTTALAIAALLSPLAFAGPISQSIGFEGAAGTYSGGSHSFSAYGVTGSYTLSTPIADKTQVGVRFSAGYMTGSLKRSGDFSASTPWNTTNITVGSNVQLPAGYVLPVGTVLKNPTDFTALQSSTDVFLVEINSPSGFSANAAPFTNLTGTYLYNADKVNMAGFKHGTLPVVTTTTGLAIQQMYIVNNNGTYYISHTDHTGTLVTDKQYATLYGSELVQAGYVATLTVPDATVHWNPITTSQAFTLPAGSIIALSSANNTSVTLAQVQSHAKFNLNDIPLHVGPTIEYDICQYVSAFVSPFIGVNIRQYDLNMRSSLINVTDGTTLESRNSKKRDTSVHFSAGATVGLAWKVTDSFTITTGATFSYIDAGSTEFAYADTALGTTLIQGNLGVRYSW